MIVVFVLIVFEASANMGMLPRVEGGQSYDVNKAGKITRTIRSARLNERVGVKTAFRFGCAASGQALERARLPKNKIK